MAVNQEQASILAKLRKRSAGSYERVKKAEAKPGGRSLPGGLKDAVAQATGLKFSEDKNGNPFAYLYQTCVEPAEHAGIFAGVMFQLSESQFRSYDEEYENFITALKLMGYADKIEKASEEEFWNKVLPWIMKNIDEEKPYILFNTSRRASKDGSYRVFISGVPDSNYEPPAREESQNEHESEGYEEAPKSKSNGKSKPEEKPTKSAPPKKGKAPPKAKKPEWEEGQAVKTEPDYFEDGNSYDGVIQSLDEDNAKVEFEDGQVLDIPLSSLLPT